MSDYWVNVQGDTVRVSFPGVDGVVEIDRATAYRFFRDGHAVTRPAARTVGGSWWQALRMRLLRRRKLREV